MVDFPIQDDLELLRLFLSDMSQQSALWQPTSYWQGHCERIGKELAVRGLKDFRQNWNLMRGVDLGFKYTGLDSLNLRPSRISRLFTGVPPVRELLNQYENHLSKVRETWDRTLHQHLQREAAMLFALLSRGETSSEILRRVSDSGVGLPDSYDFDGHRHTSNLLHHICLFALTLQAEGATDCSRVIEIGGGYGALPELWRKLGRGMPDGYFVEIDIPPLVYVTTQYLRAIFPGDVIDYREIRQAKRLTASDINGKIVVIPPWLVPTLDLEFDLLWNSISFQEMEHEVVENYLDHLAKGTRSIFINTRTQGHRKGLGGQRDPITFRWLGDRLAARGYEARHFDEGSVEWAAFRAVLPHHSAGLFTKDER